MRIAIIADALDQQYAGIYIYTKEIIKALAKEMNFKDELIIIRENASQDFKNVTEIAIPNRKLPGYSAYRLLVLIPRALIKAKAEVVIEPRHFGPFNLPPTIKRVTVIHDLTPLLFPEWHQAFSRTLQKLFLPSILRRADLIITNSNYTSQDVNKMFPFTKDKTASILLGKDKIFHPTSDSNILKKYDVHEPYFLFVGTFEPRKNLHTLLTAYEHFRTQSDHHYQLVLIGKNGWKTNNLLEKVAASSFQRDIIITGYVEREELPIFYTMAKAMIYPSLYEGFGLPVLEAMACGTQVICSNTSSLPEVGGQVAQYFAPNDYKALSHLMEESISEPIATTSLLYQAKQFSWSLAAQQLLFQLRQI